MKIYIITFEYHGESGSGIVGAYASEKEVQKVMDILDNHGDMSKVFKVKTIDDVEVESWPDKSSA
jgi:hypothetical protein